MSHARALGRADALRMLGLSKHAEVLTSFPMPGATQVPVGAPRTPLLQAAANKARTLGSDAMHTATRRLTPGKGALLGLLAGGALLGARKMEPTYTINPSAGYVPVYP